MDEETFRRAVVASPENDALRLVYADWLEEQGDPRAELLRNDWDLPRISFVDWDWVQQGLTYYLEKFPELGDQLNEHEGNRRWREGVSPGPREGSTRRLPWKGLRSRTAAAQSSPSG